MPSGYGGQSQQRWGDNTINPNEYMRDVQMGDLTGKVCSTADARKKGMLVLAFFDTTSPACRVALPYLQKLADAYKESGKLTVWGVSEDDADTTRAFAQEHGITFPILLDYDRYHTLVWGINTFPTIFLSDGGGVVQRKVNGWSRAAINDISAKVAAFAEIEQPVVIVEDSDPSPATLKV
jgi:peroxiredoxin